MTVSKILGLLAVQVLAGSLAMSALAADSPNWDRRSAAILVQSVDTTEVRQGLLNLTLAGNSVDVLNLLQDTAGRTDWPVPAREAALYAYTRDLGSLTEGTVAPEIMTWLKAYQPATLVPHEDHASSGVPMFNIRAAASGVEHRWIRQAAIMEGLALVVSNPRSLVDVYLIETHPAARLGYLQALDQATPAQLVGVSKTTARRIRSHPELTPLAGRAALIEGNMPALQEVFTLGGGPGLSHLMRDAAASLSGLESAELLRRTIDQAPSLNVSIAIAELAPSALRAGAGEDALLDLLEHPELGSTAAIALARDGSPSTVQALIALAGSGETPAASRARLALDLRESEMENLR